MTYQVAVALIRQGDNILLVCQQGTDDSVPYWALPAGAVESGELFTDALIREIREETSLTVTKIGRLVYMVQTVSADTESSACVFEVIDWTGSPHVTDDADVKESAFVPLAEALVRLEHIPFLNMREPILAYLRGEVKAGAAWFYRAHADNSQGLISCLTS